MVKINTPLALCSVGLAFLLSGQVRCKQYSITTEWNSAAIDNHEPITVEVTSQGGELRLILTAPYFNSPYPEEPLISSNCPQRPYFGLYNYEVVEVFFLNGNDEYLEIEVSPRGRYFNLLLKGQRVEALNNLPLFPDGVDIYNPCLGASTFCDTPWNASFNIPSEYLPLNVTKFNAYAIHGRDSWGNASATDLVYESLFPVPEDQLDENPNPDFHNLKFFGDIDLLADAGYAQPTERSDLWKEVIGSEDYPMTYELFHSSDCQSVSKPSNYQATAELKRSNQLQSVNIFVSVRSDGTGVFSGSGTLTENDEAMWISITNDNNEQLRSVELYTNGTPSAAEELYDLTCSGTFSDWHCSGRLSWEVLPLDLKYMQVVHTHAVSPAFVSVLCPGVEGDVYDWLGCQYDRRFIVEEAANSVANVEPSSSNVLQSVPWITLLCALSALQSLKK